MIGTTKGFLLLTLLEFLRKKKQTFPMLTATTTKKTPPHKWTKNKKEKKAFGKALRKNR